MIDQEFDFDDIDYSPNKKATKNNKKPAYDDDFFQFDDKPQSKLPTINNRNVSAKSIESEIKSTKRYNPYTEKMKSNNNYDNDFEDSDTQQKKFSKNNKKASIADSTPGEKKNSSKMKVVENKDENFYDFQEQVIQKPKIINPVPNQKDQKKQQEDDLYAQQQFQQDVYGEDFEEVQEVKPVISQKKKVQPPIRKVTPPQKKSTIKLPKQNNPPKPPIKPIIKKQISTKVHHSVNKPPIIQRSNSRKSIRSIDSMKNKSIVSRSIKAITNSSLFIPNKYKGMVDKQFPEVDAEKQSTDSINRINDKMRAMIKKLNFQLNDIINKNLVQMKNNKNGKTVNVEDRIRILQQQRKNNDAAIERMQYELNKLQGRQGEIKQQQYQIITDKKIQQTKQNIKKLQKQIHQLQVDVDSDGNKLTKKNIEKRIAQQLQQLKASLIQAKKDDEKGTDKIEKLQEKFSDLQGKIQDIQYQLKEKIQQAKNKGISLQNRQELLKRFQQNKRRLEITKNYKAKMQNLMKTKADIILHESQQLRISINNCSSQIKNFYGSINHVHSQSLKVIQKAKDNPKISTAVLINLQQLQKSLQAAAQNDAYQFEVRSLSSRGELKSRSLKKNTQSTQKGIGIKLKQIKKIGQTDDVNLQKPNFMKKKNKNDEIEIEDKNELYERVWKQDQQNEKQPPKEVIQDKKPEKIIVEEKKQEDKKKPFNLKKNKNKQEKPIITDQQIPESKIQQKKQEPKKEEEKKPQDNSTVVPKMFKFRKNRNTEEIKDKIEDNTQKESIKQPLKLPTKQQEPKQEIKQQSKPIFVPKRFNLRNRGQTKQNSYVPSIEQKKQENRPQQKKFSLDIGVQQNKFKFNFGSKEDINIPKEQIKIHVQEQKKQDNTKPSFNLRLRDKKKLNQNQNSDSYMPTIQKVPTIQKKVQQQKSQNSYMPTRMRGRNKEAQNVQSKNNNNNNPNTNIQNKNLYQPQQNTNNPYITSNEEKSKQQSNPYNPYMKQDNSYKRQRQGPIRKNKLLSGKNKEKFNIYQQAQDLTHMNDIDNKVQQKKQEPIYQPPKITKQQQKFDINAMLGINDNKKKNNDLDDLLGNGPKLTTDKRKKKGADFFGGLDDF